MGISLMPNDYIVELLAGAWADRPGVSNGNVNGIEAYRLVAGRSLMGEIGIKVRDF